MIYSMVPFQGHGVITDALDILCVQLTLNLFATAKFLLTDDLGWLHVTSLNNIGLS